MADLEAIDTRDLHEALAKKINGEVRAFSKLRARTPSSDSSWPRARGRRLLAAGLVGAGFSLRLRRSLKAAATGERSAYGGPRIPITSGQSSLRAETWASSPADD